MHTFFITLDVRTNLCSAQLITCGFEVNDWVKPLMILRGLDLIIVEVNDRLKPLMTLRGFNPGDQT